MPEDEFDPQPADTPTIDSEDTAALRRSSAPQDTPTLDSSPTDKPEADPDILTASLAKKFFGEYELLEEIARGGMGIVFKARQKNLNRVVALKMILAGQFAGEKDVQRFQTEAESAARLDHPGIVPIFEIGEHEGQHYFSMGYVDGESLADRVSAGPLTPNDAAKLVQKISESMAYAHERGVIHRDLKPANVLIDAAGQPKITDFGLAKKTEADSDLTGTGQILGTPAYMPPEQASGNAGDVGPLADVYSLGAILYCLLTGRPPFQAAGPLDVLRQVLDEDPVPARQLVPTIPRDLATICGKCLSKDPAKRYASAQDLAADLKRHLSDEPIQARPAGRIERASKWASKQPTIAAILLTMPAWLLGEPKIGVGLLSLIAGFHLPFRFRFFRIAVVFAASVFVALMIGGLNALYLSFEGETPATQARSAAINLLCFVGPVAAAVSVFLFDCISELQSPHRQRGRWLLLWSLGASFLCVGGFFYYLRDHGAEVSVIVDQLAGEVVSLTATPQANVDEVQSSGAMVQLFRSRTVLWIPVYVAIIGVYLVLGIATARFIRRFVFVTDKNTRGNQWSQLVKTVDGDVSRWLAIAAAVMVAILPYVVGSLIGIYDLRLMQAFELGNPLDSIIWVFAAAWLAAFAVISHRRFLIAIGVASCLALFLGFRTYEVVQENLPMVELKAQDSLPKVEPDDSLMVELDGHTGPIKYVDVDPSGKRAATASGWPKGDGTLRVWNTKSEKLHWVRHLAPANVLAVKFTSDGTRVVAGSDDGMITVWETETARELNRFATTEKIEGIQLVSDDEQVIIAANKVQAWDLERKELVREYSGSKDRQLDVSVSGDNKRIATGGLGKTVHIWELESGKKVADIEFSANVESVVLNQDGSRVIVALSPGNDDSRLTSVSVEDTDDRDPLRGHEMGVNWIRYSNDKKQLISASRDRTIRIWDAETLKEIKVIRGHQDWVWSAIFTPDGKAILSGGGAIAWDNPGSDYSFRIWSTDWSSNPKAKTKVVPFKNLP